MKHLPIDCSRFLLKGPRDCKIKKRYENKDMEKFDQ